MHTRFWLSETTASSVLISFISYKYTMFEATKKLLLGKLWALQDCWLGSYEQELISDMKEIINAYEIMCYHPTGWWVRVSKEDVIKMLKWKKKHNEYWFPFEIMCYEYGKNDPCEECIEEWLDECVCWNGLETDDIETLEEDVDNFYENFELRF